MADKEWFDSWQRRALEVFHLTGASEAECPVCGGTKHKAVPFVTAPWTSPPGEGFNNEGLFLLPVACQKCMHVRLFLATGLAMISDAAGLEKDRGPKSEDD